MVGLKVQKNPRWLTAIIWWVACLLFAWGLTSILYQYQWYFPPDFESSDFLLGRRASFRGAYQWAFYVHIICGPIAIVLAGLLIFSGGISQYRRTHRLLGRILASVIILGLLPSGILMATQAYTGQIAGWGFVSLAIATAVCTTLAVSHAMKKRYTTHRRWAIRCFILLCSPLLLRFVASTLTDLGIESDWTYRVNAWLSWLLPVLIFEVVRKLTKQHKDLTTHLACK
jgi:uncharacterized membrane protein YozB (DUF420 family)